MSETRCRSSSDLILPTINHFYPMDTWIRYHTQDCLTDDARDRTLSQGRVCWDAPNCRNCHDTKNMLSTIFAAINFFVIVEGDSEQRGISEPVLPRSCKKVLAHARICSNRSCLLLCTAMQDGMAVGSPTAGSPGTQTATHGKLVILNIQHFHFSSVESKHTTVSLVTVSLLLTKYRLVIQV